MTPADERRFTKVPSLGERDVHVWRISVARAGRSPGALLEVLSADERERASRFAVEKPRIQYIVGRAALRTILAAYSNRLPHTLCFTYERYGKPVLANAPSFNVSHSEDAVVIAVTQGREIGVDVERCREDFELEELAANCFCASEIDGVRRTGAEQRARIFFFYWTSKEAVMKASGDGLQLPLKDVCVAADGGAAVAEVTLRRGACTERWFAYRLDVGSDFAAAVAARSSDLRISLLDGNGLLAVRKGGETPERFLVPHRAM